jgi:serine/threonine-protein kinase
MRRIKGGSRDSSFRGTGKLPLAAGTVIDGKYRILDEVLGMGSTGIVVAALHVPLDRRVAIKFMLPEVARNGEAAIRFLLEARTASKVEGDHAARVLDAGRLEGSGLPYMVMERVDGPNLAELLRREGFLPVDTAVDFILQACDALSRAHACGIVHRDFKPENVVLSARRDGSPCLKLLDFGIAKALETDAELPLKTQLDVAGSPAYMSPEQMLAPGNVDARTDIWSLGVTLYELLNGQLPFGNPNIIRLCANVLVGTPRPIRQDRADLPVELETIVLKCLEKERENRFPSVAALADALRSFAAGRSGDRTGEHLRLDARALASLAAARIAAATELELGANELDLRKTRKTTAPRHERKARSPRTSGR